MTFYFQENQAIINISVQNGIIKVDVDLENLSNIGPSLEGWEVVVIFTLRNFENSGIFYTDSNGLEM